MARAGTAKAMDAAFQYVPDKMKAWEDLHLLRRDESGYVRGIANHSLGKICIYKTSQSENEEEFIKELENSILFFAKSFEEFNHSPIYPPQYFAYRSTFLFIR